MVDADTKHAEVLGRLDVMNERLRHDAELARVSRDALAARLDKIDVTMNDLRSRVERLEAIRQTEVDRAAERSSILRAARFGAWSLVVLIAVIGSLVAGDWERARAHILGLLQ